MRTETARRIGAAAAACGAIAMSCFSLYTSAFKVCDDQLAQTGDTDLVRVCRPLELTDPPILGLGLVAAALIAPDVSEFGLFGLVTWKKRVEETAASQVELSQRFAELKLSSLQAQAQTLNVNVVPDPVALEVALSNALTSVQEKEARGDD